MDTLPEELMRNSPKLFDFVLGKFPKWCVKRKSDVVNLKDAMVFKVPDLNTILDEEDVTHINEIVNEFWKAITDDGKKKGKDLLFTDARKGSHLSLKYEYARPSFDNVFINSICQCGCGEEYGYWIHIDHENEFAVGWTVWEIDHHGEMGDTYIAFEQMKAEEYTVPILSIMPHNPHVLSQGLGAPEQQHGAMTIGYVLKIFSIINCKNVEFKTFNADAKIQKKRIRNKRLPITEYHTLIIKPSKSKKSGPPQYLWSTRTHMCRGHFRTYTKESPLFGKYTGRFWIPQHVRGSGNQGTVIKDYELEA